MEKIGFVGLGTMGAPMAGHLLAAGHALTVWNRTPGRSDELIEKGAKRASSLHEMGKNCTIVFLCVRATEDVRECVQHLLHDANQRILIVDHSTISPIGAREIHAEVTMQGHSFLDAPITGGSMGAINGTLTIFCGGTPEAFAHAEPIMKAYAKRSELVGGPGKGQMMKMANQIAVSGSLIGLCESLAFAQQAGLDLALSCELLAGGAAGSWAFENYGPKILNRDWSPGFSASNQHKDLVYCVESAEEVNAKLPMSDLVKTLLAEMVADGHGDDASCALFEYLLPKDKRQA